MIEDQPQPLNFVCDFSEPTHNALKCRCKSLQPLVSGSLKNMGTEPISVTQLSVVHLHACVCTSDATLPGAWCDFLSLSLGKEEKIGYTMPRFDKILVGWQALESPRCYSCSWLSL
eukprot:m.165598 g.165598  ORF g.165598 m.165598 type:complete len:116 (+) comp15233_c0_seq4:417-764(+)